MARNMKVKFTKTRNPIIVLVCEGRNKTESKYFNHFVKRENPYNLKIVPSEATDPKNMAKKAKRIIEEMQLDNKLGDRVFCLVDLDLSPSQYQKVEEKKNKAKKKCQVEFILSNPCFEVWLLYYFTKHPKQEISSQKVKEQLKKYVPQYTESFDIVKECGLQDKFAVAINNSELKNQMYDKDQCVLNKNPYTEISDLLDILLTYKMENNK